MTGDGSRQGRWIARRAACRWATLALLAAFGGAGVGAQVVGRAPDPTALPAPGLAPAPRLPPAPGAPGVARRPRMNDRHRRTGPHPRLAGWAWVPVCGGPTGSQRVTGSGRNDGAAPAGVVPVGDPTAIPRYAVPTYGIPTYAIPQYTPAPAPTAVGVTSGSNVLCDGGAVYWVAEPQVTRRAPDRREHPTYRRRRAHDALPPITRTRPR